jgi:hypothetical protein
MMVDQYRQYDTYNDDLIHERMTAVDRMLDAVRSEVGRAITAALATPVSQDSVTQLLRKKDAEIERLKANLAETNRQFGQTLETCTAAVAEVERLREENSRLANRIAAKP